MKGFFIVGKYRLLAVALAALASVGTGSAFAANIHHRPAPSSQRLYMYAPDPGGGGAERVIPLGYPNGVPLTGGASNTEEHNQGYYSPDFGR
jgi:hypothetical protein